MTQIKSKDAKSYLSSTAMHPNSPLAQCQCYAWRDRAILEAIHIAEAEIYSKAVVAHKQLCCHLNERGNCTCSSIQATKCPTQNFMCGYMISFINELSK